VSGPGELESAGFFKKRLKAERSYPMKTFVNQLWTEDDSTLTLEWILLVTLLVIGIVGGVASVRDAIIDEIGDVSQTLL